MLTNLYLKQSSRFEEKKSSIKVYKGIKLLAIVSLLLMINLVGGVTVRPCGNWIYGCESCSKTTRSGQDFYECDQCMSGLFLFSNTTSIGGTPTKTTGCVQDCQSIAHNLVNDPMTMKCRSCGEGCLKCHHFTGCQKCQTSTHVEVEEAVNALSSQFKFKVCKRCDQVSTFQGSWPCRTCSKTGSTVNCLSTDAKYSGYLATKKYVTDPSQSTDVNCLVVPQDTNDKACTLCKGPYGTKKTNSFTGAQCSVKCIDNCDECWSVTDTDHYCQKCDAGSYPTSTSVYTYNGIDYNSIDQCKPCQTANQVLNQGCHTCTAAGCTKCFPEYIPKDIGGGKVRCDKLKREGCHSDCLECFGPGQSECLKCKPGKYLTHTTHTCADKQTTTPRSLYFFVIGANTTDLNNEGGEFTNPISDILRAFDYAYSWMADDAYVTFYLYLSNETHYVIGKTEHMWMNSVDTFKLSDDLSRFKVFLQPAVCGETIDGSLITQANFKCSQAGAKVTIHNKIGGLFNMRVGEKLTLKNVIIDSISTQVKLTDACRYTKGPCCILGSTVTNVGSAQCLQPYTQQTGATVYPPVCSYPGAVSMFQFTTSTLTTPTYPGELTLDGVEIRHSFYDLYSLILINNNAGKVTIKNSKLIKNGFCGPIVTNKGLVFQNYHEQEGTSVTGKEAAVILKRSVRLRLADHLALFPTQTVSGCASTHSTCTFITIDALTYDDNLWGLPKHQSITKATITEHGHLLAIDGYPGATLVKNSFIQNTQIKLNHCNLFDNQASLPTGSIFSDGGAITISFICVENSKGYLEIIGTEFKKLSGYSDGMIISFTKQEGPFVFKSNKFTQNQGALGASLIYVKDATQCGGISIESNEFKQNMRCPYTDETTKNAQLVNLECGNQAAAIALGTTTETKTTTSGSSYSTTAVIQTSNSYLQNFYLQSPLIKVLTFPDLQLKTETFTDNVGNIFKEAADNLSPVQVWHIGSYNSDFDYWGKNLTQSFSRMINLEGNKQVNIDTININDPSDLCIQNGNDGKYMTLIMVKAPSGSTNTIKSVTIPRLNGGNETTIGAYTTGAVTTTATDNFYTVGGKNIKKGIFGPLFEFHLDANDATLTWDGLVLYNTVGVRSGSKTTPLLFNWLGSHTFSSLTFKNFHLKSVHSYGSSQPFIEMKQQVSSTYTFENFYLESFGESRSFPVAIAPIRYHAYESPGTPYQTFNIKNITCINIFSSTSGCIEFIATTSTSSVHIQTVNIELGTFKSIYSATGAITLSKGYHGIYLLLKSSNFELNDCSKADAAPDLTMRSPQQTDQKLTIQNCTFKNMKHSHGTTTDTSGTSINADLVDIETTLEISDTLIDCMQPSVTHQDVINNNFYANVVETDSMQLAVLYLNSQSITFTRVTIQNCHKLKNGAIYVQGPVTANSVAIINCSGYESAGVQYNSGSSTITLTNFTTKNLMARNGAAFYHFTGYVNIIDSKFEDGYGDESGALYGIDNQNYKVTNSKFINNRGIKGAAIGFKFFKKVYCEIKGCEFYNNTAETGGVVDLTFVIITIDNCTFKGNQAVTGYAGVFGVQSTVTLTNSKFDMYSSTTPQSTAHGGYISILFKSKFTVTSTTFSNGYFQQGGAIMVDGKSDLTLTSCTIQGIRTIKYGSGLYISNFNTITLDQVNILNCWNDLNNKGGGFIYGILSGKLVLKQSTFTINTLTQAINMVYLQNIRLDTNQLTIDANWPTAPTTSNSINLGGGLHLSDMEQINILHSTIKGMKGTEHGGGITITFISYSDHYQYHNVIQNTTIQGNEANTRGGGVYLENVRFLQFTNSTITSNKVVSGQGGGVYYHSSTYNKTKKNVSLDQSCHVANNNVFGSGGAFAWNYFALDQFPTNANLQGNIASAYGDVFASYAKQITLSTTKRRQLFSLSNMQSGGLLPTIYGALIDSHNQVVKIDSNSLVTLSASTSTNNNISTVLKGNISQSVEAGVFSFTDVRVISKPGTSFSLYVTTNGIDPTLPDNLGKFTIPFSLRNCTNGEAYLATGECKECESGKTFLLVPLITVGACRPCLTEEMYCKGGTNVGPTPGHWRSSNTSYNFYACLRPQACLGMFPPTNNPTGICQSGFEGRLCAQCSSGYSMTGEFNCFKCPHLALNILRILGTLIGGIVLIVIMVKTTIQSALKKKKLESIFFKILMNHLQLVVLASTFDLQWPSEIKQFFSSQKPAANASTQFLSVDCFLFEFQALFDLIGLRIYFFKLILYGLIPIILAICASIFWSIKTLKCLKGNPKLVQSRTIATIIILMFLMHPSIVQEMFGSLNCTEIDGKNYLMLQIDIECYSASHIFWVLAVSIPALVIWGLGIPLFAGLVLFRNRLRLHTALVKSKYGFLFNGYKRHRYYWESIIMYRKIMIIFISVQLKAQGTIMQALFASLLLVIFLILNLQLKPFQVQSLNKLETLSIFASLTTMYSGFFYLSHKPDVYNSSNPDIRSADNGFRLDQASLKILMIIIFGSNAIFILYWIIKFLKEISKSLRQKFPKLYLLFVYQNNKTKMLVDIQKGAKKEESEALRGELEIIVNKIFKAFDSGDLMLTPNLIEKMSIYLDVDKIKEGIRYQDHQQVDQIDMTKQDLLSSNKRPTPTTNISDHICSIDNIENLYQQEPSPPAKSSTVQYPLYPGQINTRNEHLTANANDITPSHLDDSPGCTHEEIKCQTNEEVQDMMVLHEFRRKQMKLSRTQRQKQVSDPNQMADMVFKKGINKRMKSMKKEFQLDVDIEVADNPSQPRVNRATTHQRQQTPDKLPVPQIQYDLYPAQNPIADPYTITIDEHDEVVQEQDYNFANQVDQSIRQNNSISNLRQPPWTQYQNSHHKSQINLRSSVKNRYLDDDKQSREHDEEVQGNDR